MADQPKRKQPTKSLGPTHWDPETGEQEIPTLTSLMNRKKLDVSKPLTQKAKPAPSKPNRTADITLADHKVQGDDFQIETNQLKTNAYMPRPTPSVTEDKIKRPPQAIKQDRRASRPQISFWTPDSLKRGKEPYERALMHLLKHGLTAALYLQADQRSPYNRKLPPIFLARTAFGSRQQLAVWNGLRWDPAQFQILWDEFFQSTCLELEAPSAGIPSPTPSPKTFLRSAFGVDPSDIITLVRIGTKDQTDGMLALLSRRSLQEEIALVIDTLITGKAERKSA